MQTTVRCSINFQIGIGIGSSMGSTTNDWRFEEASKTIAEGWTFDAKTAPQEDDIAGVLSSMIASKGRGGSRHTHTERSGLSVNADGSLNDPVHYRG
jgi:hypothetical protein